MPQKKRVKDKVVERYIDKFYDEYSEEYDKRVNTAVDELFKEETIEERNRISLYRIVLEELQEVYWEDRRIEGWDKK